MKIIATAKRAVLTAAILLLPFAVFAGSQIRNLSIKPEYLCPGQVVTVTFEARHELGRQIYASGVFSLNNTMDITDTLWLWSNYPTTKVGYDTWDATKYFTSPTAVTVYLPYSLEITVPATYTDGQTVYIIVRIGDSYWTMNGTFEDSLALPFEVTCRKANAYNRAQLWYQYSDAAKLTIEQCLVTPTPTPSPTRTNTPTPTRTNTPTNTATNSATASSTSTATRTLTNTPTNTRTNTPTSTSTNTNTNTATNTPTNTPTNTRTNTPTNTNTSTFTPTNTVTNTNSPTNTATNTPTNTVTNTRTNTPTNTSTNTFTPTNTVTNTNSPTNTLTNSATASSTSTPTWTPTNTATNTYTATVTRTNTPTNTATNTPTFTNTITGTNSPSFTPTSTATNTMTDTFTATSTRTRTNTATPTNTSTSTNSPTNTFTPSFTPTSTNTYTYTETVTGTNTPTLTNTRTFTPTLTWTGTQPPTWTYTNTPTETNSYTQTYTRTFTNTPTLTFTPTFTNTPSNTFTYTNTRTDTPTYTPSYTATETNSATASSTSTLTWTPTSTFTATNTRTPTSTWTPTFTRTDTPVNTATYTNTSTYTWTPSFTPTNTRTFTSTYTATATWTPTNTWTNSFTATNTFTFTATNTATSTFTATNTFTASRTSTSSVSPTPSSTATATPTQPPFPYTLRIALYNAAGELVSVIAYLPATNLLSDIQMTGEAGAKINGLYGGGNMFITLPGVEVPQSVGAGSTVFTWNGSNTSGQAVANGIYTLSFEQKDSYGHTSIVTKSLQVTRAEWGVSITVYNSSGETIKKIFTNQQPVNGSLKLSIDDVLPITDSGSKISFKYGEGLTDTVVWDGLNEFGKAVTSGNYEIKVTYVSPEGASSFAAKSVVIINGSKADPGTVKAFPNPAITGKGRSIKFTWERPGQGNVIIRVYDVAGQKVKELSGDFAAGTIAWNFERELPPGMYVAVVEASSTEGYTGRSKVKFCLTSGSNAR